MTVFTTAGIIIGIVILMFIVFRVFKSPLKTIVKFIINTALGFIALILINEYGSAIGLGIGVNVVNALVIGGLGVPGVGLLLVLRWLMIT